MVIKSSIHVGAENIVCPLGENIDQTFEQALKGINSITEFPNKVVNGKPVLVSRFSDERKRNIKNLIIDSVQGSIGRCSYDPLKADKTLFILSTTKGNIDELENSVQDAMLGRLLNEVVNELGFSGNSFVVSNACISGLLSVITAHDLMQNGFYDHAVICGADMVSDFTLSGFGSLFAMDDKPCKPFDKARAGITLGEGAASLVLSKNADIFDRSFTYCGGASANDANHISGPSRTGEGLYRAIKKSLEEANIQADEIDQIAAHGTATMFNDDMESIAFDRIGCEKIPLHSYKGYFGHTLGAAGLMELALLFRSTKEEVILPCAGFSDPGTTKALNVVSKTVHKTTSTLLKTSSGFGGCNASAIFHYEG